MIIIKLPYDIWQDMKSNLSAKKDKILQLNFLYFANNWLYICNNISSLRVNVNYITNFTMFKNNTVYKIIVANKIIGFAELVLEEQLEGFHPKIQDIEEIYSQFTEIDERKYISLDLSTDIEISLSSIKLYKTFNKIFNFALFKNFQNTLYNCSGFTATGEKYPLHLQTKYVEGLLMPIREC